MNKRQRKKAQTRRTRQARLEFTFNPRDAQEMWDRLPRFSQFGFPPHGTCVVKCRCGEGLPEEKA